MKAVGYFEKGLAIDHDRALLDLEIPEPGAPAGHDLLVRVRAVSVNPRDIKSRRAIGSTDGKPVIIGYDASGVVEAVGPLVRHFKPGDEVFYAGVINRPGSNAEWQWVDERIAGPKPRSLDHAAAASLPLTMLTACEMLFDRLQVPQEPEGEGAAILILGGAGGVPSASIQLLRLLTRMTVIATASRPESRAWVTQMGAQQVVDHSKPLARQIADIGLTGKVGHVFSAFTTPQAWADFAELISPQGKIGLIDDMEPLDLRLMKVKSISIHWEAMFTRPLYGTPDLDCQREWLTRVSGWVDAGKLKATAQQNFGLLNAANLRRAHAAIESGRVIGKIVLDGIA